MPEADPTEKTAFALNDLENALRGPDCDTVRTELLVRLDMLLQNMNAQMKSGISQPEFVQAGIIVKGLAAAREIVQIIHPQHGGNLNG